MVLQHNKLRVNFLRQLHHWYKVQHHKNLKTAFNTFSLCCNRQAQNYFLTANTADQWGVVTLDRCQTFVRCRQPLSSWPEASIPQQARHYSPTSPFSPPFPKHPSPSFPSSAPLVLPFCPLHSPSAAKRPFGTSYGSAGGVWGKGNWQQLLYGFLYTEIC